METFSCLDCNNLELLVSGVAAEVCLAPVECNSTLQIRMEQCTTNSNESVECPDAMNCISTLPIGSESIVMIQRIVFFDYVFGHVRWQV